jgi:hypothetical protein
MMYVQSIKAMQAQMQMLASMEDSKTAGPKQREGQEVDHFRPGRPGRPAKTNDYVCDGNASHAVAPERLDDQANDLNLVSIPGVPESSFPQSTLREWA